MPNKAPQTWLTETLSGPPFPFPNISEQEIWKLATENGVLLLLHWKLYGSENWNIVPKTFRNKLQTMARQEAAAELLREQETTQVLQTLEEQNIQPLLLKGTPLAYSLYPQPHLRSRCDTDLLFQDRETAESAWRILKNRGYQRPDVISGEHVSHQFPCYRTSIAGLGHSLDIHWKINNSQYLASILPYEELAKQAKPVPKLGPFARTPGSEHTLLLACAHRIVHKPEGTENRMIWLYDIHLLAENMNQSQWKNFLQMAKQKELTHTCRDGIKKAAEYFQTQLQEDIQGILKAGPETEAFTPDTANSRWKSELINLRSLPGWKPRIKLLKEHLFPPTSYIMKKYKTKNPALLPWLYLKRATQGLVKTLR